VIVLKLDVVFVYRAVNLVPRHFVRDVALLIIHVHMNVYYVLIVITVEGDIKIVKGSCLMDRFILEFVHEDTS
jgi:hypothetical protein